MKKQFAILVLAVFILAIAPLCLASIFDYKTSIDMSKGGYYEFDNGHKVGEGNSEITKLWETYKPIEIKNWLGKTKLQIALTEHTEVCGNDNTCFSKMEIYLANDGVLIDDNKFYTLKDGKWIEQDIRWSKFQYWGDIDTYETQCTKEEIISKNETYTPQVCEQVKVGTHKGWIDYNLGDEVKAGNYEVQLLGEKKPSRTVDWRIETQGKVIEELAVWGNISLGDDAEVILNSPADGSTAFTNPVTFNATANVTGGATLTNISLWTNESGSWGIVNIINLLPKIPTYSGFNFNTRFSGNPRVGWNGINVIVLENQNPQFPMEKYNTEGSYISQLTGDISEDATPEGFTWDGTNYWVIGFTNNIVYKYFSNGTYTGTSFSFASEDTRMFDITWDGTYFWLVADTDNVYRYTSAGVYDSFSFSTSSQTTTAKGITYDGDKLWVVDSINSGKTYEYYTNGTYTGNNFTSGNQSPSMASITYNGGGFYMSDFTSDNIWKYDFVFLNSTTQTWSRTITEDIIWNIQACDSDGVCGFAPSNFTVSPDSTAPNITVPYPTGLIDYKKYGDSLDLNWTVIDDGTLDTCWINYNNTNTTVTCGDNHTTFNLNTDKTLTFYANDSFNNLASEIVSWDYKVFENSRTLNTSSYETQSETFQINISANSSLTAVTLDYNGTEYSTTKSGTEYSKTLDIPTGVQNRSIRWKFTYGDSIYSDYSYQNISEAVWTLCNASYTDDFLNITFKDEADLEVTNASIPTSTFNYYLGSGTVTKEYQFENTSVNYDYEFCATPDLNFNIDAYVQYKQGTDYPQRIYDPDVLTLNSTVTNKILYLLNAIDGIYVIFQVINSAEQGITDVEVTGTREISGEDVIVANGLTDAAGAVTFWLNPDFVHTFVFSKTGYETTTYSVTPTQSSYTITLGGGVAPESDCTRGVGYTITPSNNFLDQNTEYDFTFTIDSSYWALTGFNASLYYGNDTLVDSDSSTVQEGGTLTFSDINTTNQTEMYLRYQYDINDSVCVSTSTNWIIQSIDGRDYSLWNLFTQSTEYLDANLYGVKGDAGNSDFGKIVIVFLIIVLVAGVSIQQFGIQSEQAIMSIVFALVAMLDVGLGFIPRIQLGGITAIPYFVTIIVFIMWMAFLIKER